MWLSDGHERAVWGQVASGHPHFACCLRRRRAREGGAEDACHFQAGCLPLLTPLLQGHLLCVGIDVTGRSPQGEIETFQASSEIMGGPISIFTFKTRADNQGARPHQCKMLRTRACAGGLESTRLLPILSSRVRKHGLLDNHLL